MKTPKELIEAYAHDYRYQEMSEEELNEMLWEFWREAEKEMRETHLSQFCSRINSHGFHEWYMQRNPQSQ